jgi:hypothetical protein
MRSLSELKKRGNPENPLPHPKIPFGFHGPVLRPFRLERQAEYCPKAVELQEGGFAGA